MNVPPYSANPSATNSTRQAARSRFFSTRSWMTGCRFLGESSHTSRLISETPERIERRTIQAFENQSFEFPCSSTYWSEPTPAVSSAIPSQSTSPSCRR